MGIIRARSFTRRHRNLPLHFTSPHFTKLPLPTNSVPLPNFGPCTRFSYRQSYFDSRLHTGRDSHSSLAYLNSHDRLESKLPSFRSVLRSLYRSLQSVLWSFSHSFKFHIDNMPPPLDKKLTPALYEVFVFIQKSRPSGQEMTSHKSEARMTITEMQQAAGYIKSKRIKVPDANFYAFENAVTARSEVTSHFKGFLHSEVTLHFGSRIM